MLFLSDNNQTDIIEAFNSISRYLGQYTCTLHLSCRESIDNLCFNSILQIG